MFFLGAGQLGAHSRERKNVVIVNASVRNANRTTLLLLFACGFSRFGSLQQNNSQQLT
jgi:hypothetical protein